MRKSLWMVGLMAGLLLSMPGIGQAVEESNSIQPRIYERPFFKALSNDGEGWDLSDGFLGEGSPYDFGGWVSFGYTSGSTGLFNGPASTDDGSNAEQFGNHQTWLYLEKSMDTSEGFDWGGRFDAMYGLDAGDTQAFGNPSGSWDFENGLDHGSYGFAFPQLYLELGYKDFSVKGGHFYTLLGYEVVPAPDNFFYSHAITMYNSEAFTHTGVLASYTGFDKFELFAGWTAGWDTGFDQFGDGSSFLGGVSYTPIEQATIIYILTGGNFGKIGSGYTHSVVIDSTPFSDMKIGSWDIGSCLGDLNYVFQSDLVTTDEDVLGIGKDYGTIGVNQYLLYPLFDELGLGARAEWWRANGESYGEVTGGVNIAVLPNVMVRPEGRYQFGPSGSDNVAGLPTDVGIFGIDVIVTF